MAAIGRHGVLGESAFRLLWVGQSTSELGSALVPVALAFAVIDLTHSASSLGLVMTAGLASRVALVLVGGVFADRLSRRRLMLSADALRAAMQGVLAVLLLSGAARVWQLIVLFAVYGAADAFFSPALTGLVPDTVQAEQLQQANAMLSLSRSVAAVAGPALAGLLVATAGTGVVFALDAGTFGVSSVALALLRVSPPAREIPGSAFLADLRDGWRELTARTWVWTCIVYFSVSNVAVAPLFVLGPFVAERSLGGPAAWGLIVTCGGIGSVLGDVAALRLRPRRALLPGYLALAMWGLEPALLARPFPTAAVAGAAALGFGALSFSNALWFTALQERIPRGSISRVSAYDWLGSRAFQPLGYALAGPAGAAIGVPATLVTGAALHASASVAIAFVPAVRRLSRITPPQQ